MFILSMIILLCTLPPRAQSVRYPPRRPPWTQWVIKNSAKHLVQMTEELVKDMAYKIKHAEKVRDSLGITISFELGSVAAGVQERFYRMLNIYRKYANMKDFKAERYKVHELLNAYHIIQGDYNEIRHEKALYLEIVRRHESTTRSARDRKRTPKNGTGRRRAHTWRPGHRDTDKR